MKTMYRAAHWNGEIKEIEVLRTTEKTVTTKNGRENRMGEYASWHDTKHDAVQHLLSLSKARINQAQKVIEQQNSIIEKLKAL
jgi:hypothetical protein